MYTEVSGLASFRRILQSDNRDTTENVVGLVSLVTRTNWWWWWWEGGFLAVCQDDGSVMGNKGFEIVWSLSVIVHQN